MSLICIVSALELVINRVYVLNELVAQSIMEIVMSNLIIIGFTVLVLYFAACELTTLLQLLFDKEQ